MKKSTMGYIIISAFFLGLFGTIIWLSGWSGVLAIVIAIGLLALIVTSAHLIASDD